MKLLFFFFFQKAISGHLPTFTDLLTVSITVLCRIDRYQWRREHTSNPKQIVKKKKMTQNDHLTSLSSVPFNKFFFFWPSNFVRETVRSPCRWSLPCRPILSRLQRLYPLLTGLPFERLLVTNTAIPTAILSDFLRLNIDVTQFNFKFVLLFLSYGNYMPVSTNFTNQTN